MKINILKTIILFAAVLAFGVTHAQPPKGQLENRPNFDQLLEKMDANKDQMLSAAEVKRPLKEHFKKVDKDGNGFITAEEFENAPKPKGKGKGKDRGERPSFAKILKRMDANQDKMLSSAEVKGPLKEHFKKVDKDGNGFIDAKEFENAPKPKG
jgi:Ca2+-binding EF-hand superfamily protein